MLWYESNNLDLLGSLADLGVFASITLYTVPVILSGIIPNARPRALNTPTLWTLAACGGLILLVTKENMPVLTPTVQLVFVLTGALMFLSYGVPWLVPHMRNAFGHLRLWKNRARSS